MTDDAIWTRFVRCWRETYFAIVGINVPPGSPPSCHSWCHCGREGCPGS